MSKHKSATTTLKSVVVEAKKASKNNPARIVVRGHGHLKQIPVVYFTEKETDSLLAIVDKVEREALAK